MSRNARPDDGWQTAREDATEDAVIGQLILDPSVSRELLSVGLEPEHFANHQFRMLYWGVLNLLDRAEPVDVVSAAAEAMRNPEAIGRYEPGLLAQIAMDCKTSSPNIAGIDYHAKAIIRANHDRRLQDIGKRLYRELGDPSIPKRAAIDAALDAIAEAGDGAIGAKRKDSIVDLMRERVENIIAGNGAPESSVSSGFPAFDELTGGFRRTALIMMAAPAGLGKSAVMLQMAMKIAAQTEQCVPMFSLEMDAVDTVNRALSQALEVNTSIMHNGKFPPGWDGAMRNAVRNADGINVRIDQTRARTIPAIRAACKGYAAKHGQLGAICVDFLQLVSAGARIDNRVDEISFVSMSLKALAMEMRCPVIAISNMNRTGQKDNERPTRASLRGSGQIESDSDMIIFFWCASIAGRDEDQEVEWIIDKNRHGPVGTLIATFQKTFTKYKDELSAKQPDPPRQTKYGGR